MAEGRRVLGAVLLAVALLGGGLAFGALVKPWAGLWMAALAVMPLLYLSVLAGRAVGEMLGSGVGWVRQRVVVADD